MEQMSRSISTIEPAILYEFWELGKFNIEEKNLIWDKRKKSSFILFVLKNYPTSPLCFKTLGIKKGILCYDVLDGEERIAALKEFFENKFPVFIEQTPVFYQDLTPEQKQNFWHYKFFLQYADAADKYEFQQLLRIK